MLQRTSNSCTGKERNPKLVLTWFKKVISLIIEELFIEYL